MHLKRFVAMIICAALALLILPVSVPASAVECRDDAVCDIGEDCDPSLHQGATTSKVDIVPTGLPVNQGGYTTSVATPAATNVERWVRTTCAQVTLTATTSNDPADVDNFCYRSICYATATYDVWVDDVRSTPQNAQCTAGFYEQCTDYETIGTYASKTINVAVPNIKVITQNCGYATAYVDTDDDGSWSDESPDSQDSDCTPTDVYVGTLPG